MATIVRAIDVGFGNTKYVKASGGGKVDCAHFPSIAFDSVSDSTGEPLGGKRNTVCVPVGDLWYEVGPEVVLAADGFIGRNYHDDYMKTPEYRAFMAGAILALAAAFAVTVTVQTGQPRFSSPDGFTPGEKKPSEQKPGDKTPGDKKPGSKVARPLHVPAWMIPLVLLGGAGIMALGAAIAYWFMR